jgi:APA family basic amino acid/polyamine antiporter
MAGAATELQQPPAAGETSTGFRRELGLWDSTMIVAGSMIGSGIFIVSADIARHVGCSGWLLMTWVITGLLTMAGAFCFGTLAARMPHTGGQYAYLRELYSPLIGFLYGWALFLVVQTGTIAAVAVGFARFLGVLVPAISPTAWIVKPIHLSNTYALSLSWQQLVGVLMLVALTWLNARGLRFGRWIQNVFTSTKTVALVLLIAIGLLVGSNAEAIRANFTSLWTPVGVHTIQSPFDWAPAVTAGASLLGLLIALGVSQVGSLFSSDAWNNITFAAGEVKEPRRTIPRALVLGTGLVTLLYVLANVAYLVTLPLPDIAGAPDDRVATAMLQHVFGAAGATIMAVAIVISTFGCNNGLVLAGARVYYAMARDALFFRPVGRLNAARVPGVALWLQCAWACLLVLPRTIQRAADGAVTYNNLYSQLLDYVVGTVLIFYGLAIAGLFIVRRRAAAGAPRIAGYPLVPVLYIALVIAIMITLFVYKPDTTLPGLYIVLTGIPVFWLWRTFGGAPAADVEDSDPDRPDVPTRS